MKSNAILRLSENRMMLASIMSSVSKIKTAKAGLILRLSEGRRRKSILPSVSKIKTAKAGLNVNDSDLYLDSEKHEKSKKEY